MSLVSDILAFADVKLVPVAVARPQALISLARLMEWVEVHNQVQLVMYSAATHAYVSVLSAQGSLRIARASR